LIQDKFADELKKRVPGLKVVKSNYDPRDDTVDVVFCSDNFPESKRALYDYARTMKNNNEYGVLGKLGCRIGDVGLFNKEGNRMYNIEDIVDDKDASIRVHFVLPNYINLLANAYALLQ